MGIDLDVKPRVIRTPSAHGMADEEPCFANPSTPNVQPPPSLEEAQDEPTEDESTFAKIESINVVGQDTKTLIEMLTNLEHLGIDATNDIHLPKIVVVGDQSAGKSSLIEAISEIRVPRSSGTCTRCPLQISLVSDSNKTAWSCKVKLQRLYDYDKAGCDPNSPFYPWQERTHPLTATFIEVASKEDLEEALIRAQAAILNPAMEASNFLTLPLKSLTDPSTLQVKFSPNIICLDVCAPDIPSLAFYDLPGIINQTEDADEIHLVSLVESLAEKYVKDEGALILLACSLEGDIANSSAARLVRKFRAVNRCIGVLTKPDRFPKGDDITMIDQMLQGEKYKLGHGYFITKQPGQAEIYSIQHSDARIQERHFFENESPWNNPQLSSYRDRFGTEHLQAALSQKLAAMIVGRFSSIWNTIKQKKVELENQLANMPKPPLREESHTRVNLLLLAFSKVMEKYAKGEDSEFTRFLYDFKYIIMKRLREDLTSMKPIIWFGEARRFNVSTPDQQNSPSKRDSRISDSDSDLPRVAMRSKKRKIDEIGSGSSIVASNGVERPKSSKYALKCKPEVIQQTLSQYSVNCGINSKENPVGLDKLRLQSLEYIHLPAADFIKRTTRLVEGYTKASMEDIMKEWQSSLLFQEVQDTTSKFVSDLMEKQIQQAEHEITLEKLKPITCDDLALARLEETELESMEKSRHQYRVKDHLFNLHGPDKFMNLQQRDFDAKFKDERLKTELGPDLFMHEIRVMSRVKAYYCLATNRLVDYLVRHMHLELFQAFKGPRFYEYLLGITKPLNKEGDVSDRCSTLLADDAARENQRRILQHQKDAMEEAWKYLQQAYEKFK